MGQGLPYGLGVAPRSWAETARAQAGDPGCTGETRIVYVDDVLWVRLVARNARVSERERDAEEEPEADDAIDSTKITGRQ